MKKEKVIVMDIDGTLCPIKSSNCVIIKIYVLILIWLRNLKSIMKWDFILY